MMIPPPMPGSDPSSPAANEPSATRIVMARIVIVGEFRPRGRFPRGARRAVNQTERLARNSPWRVGTSRRPLEFENDARRKAGDDRRARMRDDDCRLQEDPIGGWR